MDRELHKMMCKIKIHKSHRPLITGKLFFFSQTFVVSGIFTSKIELTCHPLQLAEEPLLTGSGGETNMTVTRIMFGSEQVQVEEEQLAFTGTDLLADCGGILGLFIGFNFIMIVDVILIFIQRFNCKYQLNT